MKQSLSRKSGINPLISQSHNEIDFYSLQKFIWYAALYPTGQDRLIWNHSSEIHGVKPTYCSLHWLPSVSHSSCLESIPSFLSIVFLPVFKMLLKWLIPSIPIICFPICYYPHFPSYYLVPIIARDRMSKGEVARAESDGSLEFMNLKNMTWAEIKS